MTLQSTAPQVVGDLRCLGDVWEAALRKHGSLRAIGALRAQSDARKANTRSYVEKRADEALAYLNDGLDKATRAAVGEVGGDLFKVLCGPYVLASNERKRNPAPLADIGERARRWVGFAAALQPHLPGGDGPSDLESALPGFYPRMRKARPLGGGRGCRMALADVPTAAAHAARP
jgi:hypothetical protein